VSATEPDRERQRLIFRAREAWGRLTPEERWDDLQGWLHAADLVLLTRESYQELLSAAGRTEQL
jgi:hypothetical protein